MWSRFKHLFQIGKLKLSFDLNLIIAASTHFSFSSFLECVKNEWKALLLLTALKLWYEIEMLTLDGLLQHQMSFPVHLPLFILEKQEIYSASCQWEKASNITNDRPKDAALKSV